MQVFLQLLSKLQKLIFTRMMFRNMFIFFTTEREESSTNYIILQLQKHVMQIYLEL